MTAREELIREVAAVLNRCSRENQSNTPDFILAEHMVDALEAFERTSNKRDGWHGVYPKQQGFIALDPGIHIVASLPNAAPDTR